MEVQDPGAGGLLIRGDAGVGRDSGAPITPRTTHQYLIEEVISVLAFALIPKPVTGRFCIPAHSISLPEPDLAAGQAPISLAVGTVGLLPTQQGAPGLNGSPKQDHFSEQVEAGSSVELSLDLLDAVDSAFDAA